MTHSGKGKDGKGCGHDQHDHNHAHGEGCGHDHHGHEHGHHHMDDNLNYPFHYHYEAQKLGVGAKNLRAPLSLPAFIKDCSAIDFEPKNSMTTLQSAKDATLECVYLDVTITGDDEAIVCHPDDLMDTLDILTLEEALETLIDMDMNAILHVRPVQGEEVGTTGVVLDTISRIWDEDCPTLAIASELPVCLALVNEIMPSLQTVYILEEWQKENGFENLAVTIENLAPNALLLSDAKVNEEMSDKLLSFDIPLIAKMGDNPIQAKKLLRWGFDNILSSNAHILKENN